MCAGAIGSAFADLWVRVAAGCIGYLWVCGRGRCNEYIAA